MWWNKKSSPRVRVSLWCCRSFCDDVFGEESFTLKSCWCTEPSIFDSFPHFLLLRVCSLVTPSLSLSVSAFCLTLTFSFFFQPLVSDQAPFIFGPFGKADALRWEQRLHAHTHIQKRSQIGPEPSHTSAQICLIGCIHTRCPAAPEITTGWCFKENSTEEFSVHGADRR